MRRYHRWLKIEGDVSEGPRMKCCGSDPDYHVSSDQPRDDRINLSGSFGMYIEEPREDP